MSSAAAWANTSKATHWPRTGFDDWTRQATYGAPVTFDCDYSAEAKTMIDDTGAEFVTRQILYTEKANIRRGDYVAIGEFTATDPTVIDAQEVRSVKRFADTFENVTEDVVVYT